MAIVVDQPIINSPFEEPARHYRIRGGTAELVDERRPSGYMPGLRTRGGRQTLVEEEFVELPLVNDIRGRVQRWREAGYPGATRTTLDLLRHWRSAERERRLSFCQLEAAETAIWLDEGPQTEVSRLPLEQQERYRRHCLKMATGSGKTVVMAMLIAWSVLNKARQPADKRFSDAVLVLCPNLTVKERLAVLKPAAPENYYEAFDLVPSGLASALLGGRVMVTNCHALTVPDDSRRRGARGAVHDRSGYYADHRVARTMFDIAAKITDDLKFGDEQGRRLMFPQVLAIVRRYVETRLELVGEAAPEEIALGKYRSTIEARVSAAIRPADEDGDGPSALLPVLRDMAGIGTTDISPFLTSRPSLPAIKSHLSHAVVDSGWERRVAAALDESRRVHAWVKNVRLGFTIPYQHQGVGHEFTPDFLCALRGATGAPSDEHLIIEVKGLEREQDRSKDVGARRWHDAVNHWGKLGRWRYAKIHTPYQLSQVLGVADRSEGDE